jgi:uncharacterized membrane protein (UPF0127 family)
MKRYCGIIFCFLSLLIAIGGCERGEQYPLPMTQMQIGGETFGIEIATSEIEKTNGLMHRDHLNPDHGMIFIFDRPEVQNFWNHEVHFPLDLVNLDASGNIVSLKHMKPYDDKGVPSDAPAMYVIELLGGTSDRLKLKVGDHVALPDEVVHPVKIVSH